MWKVSYSDGYMNDLWAEAAPDEGLLGQHDLGTEQICEVHLQADVPCDYHLSAKEWSRSFSWQFTRQLLK